jgi:hypothetical protein
VFIRKTFERRPEMELKVTTETGTHKDMPGTRYGQYLFEHSVVSEWFGDYIGFTGESDFNSGISALYFPVFEPMFPEKASHIHDFDEYLSFFGMHPDGMKELGGEVEVCIGSEQEKHIFDKPTTLFFPAGLPHCPLKYTRVDRPFMIVHIWNIAQKTWGNRKSL